MPRPISWLPRLHEIRRSVGNSARSHYGRRDLEELFELQPRAAQMLLELLPSVRVGTSRLVEREALAAFLERVRNAEDIPKLYDQMRAERKAASRRRLRHLVQRDSAPVGIDSLPPSIHLSPGRLKVAFETVEQLAEAMYALARVLESEGDAFAERFEIGAGNESARKNTD